MLPKKSIILYHSSYSHFGGIETFCYNTIKALSPFYNITFISNAFTASDVFELAKYCHIKKYSKKQNYKADFTIFATAWGLKPTNIESKKVIQTVHADYEAYIKGWNFKYSKNPITTHHVAVSNHVKEAFERATRYKIDKVIYNLV